MTSHEQAVPRAAREGSHDAIDRLFELNWDRAWRVAHAVTGRAGMADDVAQDAFIRAVKGLRAFDGRRPFSVWLDRIVVNCGTTRCAASAGCVPWRTPARFPLLRTDRRSTPSRPTRQPRPRGARHLHRLGPPRGERP